MDRVQPDNHALWVEAMPIKKARLHFAPTCLQYELASVPAVSLSDAIFSISRTGMKDSEFMPKLLEAHKSNIALNKRRHTVLDRIDSHFSDMVVSGKLRCFAFEFPRTFTAQPVEMLPSHWTAHPDWGKGEFRAAGLHLIELRVLSAESSPAPAVPSASPRLGRPPVTPQILAAFRSLQADGSLFTRMKQNRVIDLVRQRLADAFPDLQVTEKYPNHETIRVAIVGLWKTHNKQ
jgi:hypothetical protein